jgi:hypothetical protein
MILQTAVKRESHQNLSGERSDLTTFGEEDQEKAVESFGVEVVEEVLLFGWEVVEEA